MHINTNHHQRIESTVCTVCLFLLCSQVKAAAPRPVGRAAAGVFEERGAAAGQAAMPVPQRVSGLVVRPGVAADLSAQRHLGGAEEGGVGGARRVVKTSNEHRKHENVCNYDLSNKGFFY